MILACIQNKGGVAKTTTCVNLAHALAMLNKKVLLIDLDSQGSSSLSLGINKKDITPSIAEVLIEDLPIEEAIRKTDIENLHMITGSMALANFDLSVANTSGRESLLKDVIKSVRKVYDIIIIDCPPTLSLLPINALVACTDYIVPVIPHYLSLEGLANLMQAVERVKAGMGAKCNLLGILLTLVDTRARITKEIAQLIRKQFPSQVFETEIRTNIKLAECPSFGQTIFQYDWSCTGAEAYQALAKEITDKMNIKGQNNG